MDLNVTLWWSDKAKGSEGKARDFKHFAQQMANSLIIGVFRYDKGTPNRNAKYLTRLKAELEEYIRTGNQDNLVNVANYCFLESVAPEHKKAHFEHNRTSVTRDKLKMHFEDGKG